MRVPTERRPYSRHTDRGASHRVQRNGRASAGYCVAGREANAMTEILKPRVGTQRIERRPREDRRIKPRLIRPVQPDHRPVVVAESDIDQGDTRIGWRALTLPTLQVPDDL